MVTDERQRGSQRGKQAAVCTCCTGQCGIGMYGASRFLASHIAAPVVTSHYPKTIAKLVDNEMSTVNYKDWDRMRTV